MKQLGLSLLAVALFAGAAHGFETSRIDSGSARAEPKIPAAKELRLQEEADAASGAQKGKFSLPGIGNLGVLPKLDFGLELLYGEGPAPTPQDDLKERDADPEDLTIRGTFKHRF